MLDIDVEGNRGYRTLGELERTKKMKEVITSVQFRDDMLLKFSYTNVIRRTSARIKGQWHA